MDRPGLRVLYASEGYTVHDRRFLAAFSDAGFRADHFPLTARTAEARALPEGVRRRAESAGGGARRFRAALREERRCGSFDVAVAGPLPSVAFLAASARLSPLVAVSWGSDLLVDAVRNARSGRRAAFALARAAGLLGDCEAVARAAESLGGPPRPAQLIVPWGIDLDSFSSEDAGRGLRRDLGWDGFTVFVSNRSWEPLYAVDVLVEAFARAAARRDECRLLLVGDGSLRPRIEALIAAGGLGSKIVMPGRVPNEEMSRYLWAADVYVSAALSDGTSVSMLEAMACARPVVVSRGYGNDEWVSHGENGWLAAPGNADSLGSCLLEAAASGPRRRQMGAMNRDLVRRRADWSRHARTLAEYVERIARREPRKE
jgi:L-malate glycosyltransferase